MKLIKWMAGLISLLWVGYCWDVGAPWWAAVLPPFLSVWLATPDRHSNNEFYLNNILQTLNRLEQAIHDNPAIPDARQALEQLDAISSQLAHLTAVVDLYAEVRLPNKDGLAAFRERRFFSTPAGSTDTPRDA